MRSAATICWARLCGLRAPSDFRAPGVDDSKKVTEKQRHAQPENSQQHMGIGVATAKEIDEITNAPKLAKRIEL